MEPALTAEGTDCHKKVKDMAFSKNVSIEKGLLGPIGESCGGKGGSCAGNGGRGGYMARRGGRSSRGGIKNVFVASGEEYLEGCIGAGGDEVNGGGDDFGVSKSLLGEIPSVVIDESGGETFGDDRGAIWKLATAEVAEDTTFLVCAYMRRCWRELMKLMPEVYYPRNEIQKMESEMWNLTVKNNDLAAYTHRFQELTMMCTKMVPEEEDQVEKFIGGLPDNIQRNVIAIEPAKLQDAVRMANNLMDQKLKGYAVKNVENKRRLEVNQRDNRGQ
ncbi:reverse transcriptase domain-containing protein [Tanacetum coccineum]